MSDREICSRLFAWCDQAQLDTIKSVAYAIFVRSGSKVLAQQNIYQLFVSVADLLEALGSPVPVDRVVQMAGVIEGNLIKLETNSESQETKRNVMLESLRYILADRRTNPCGKLEESSGISETAMWSTSSAHSILILAQGEVFPAMQLT